MRRNSAIINAIKDGYTQAEVSRYLGLSRSAVSKIVKSVYLMPVYGQVCLTQRVLTVR
ncbi:helix-turn-helix domain-containing protein [Sulfurovum sp.]|uniref:helix-turn-helix domain-containing protein n=1 Tax=Sulfurovum sp. TaxID=1969726 RepID=UPI00260C50B3|nr:helix-turn-helix domain-containing protein [Sulfurovum sp.]